MFFIILFKLYTLIVKIKVGSWNQQDPFKHFGTRTPIRESMILSQIIYKKFFFLTHFSCGPRCNNSMYLAQLIHWIWYAWSTTIMIKIMTLFDFHENWVYFDYRIDKTGMSCARIIALYREHVVTTILHSNSSASSRIHIKLYHA